MKTRILLLLVLCSSVCTLADERSYLGYTFDTDKSFPTWRFKAIGIVHGFFIEHLLYSEYEKEGKTYRLILGYGDAIETVSLPANFYSMRPMIGIREENGRILVNREEYMALISDTSAWSFIGEKDYIPYMQTDDGELILYDFNMHVGDKYPSVPGHTDISVVNVETLVTRDGTSRRLITLDNGYKLLEGVGCLNSQGMFFFYLNPKLSYYNQKAFLVDYLDDIFSGNDIYKIDYYYDVDALLIGSTTVKNLKTPTLFDLQGRRLQGKPQRGMYIRDGRKYVVK